MNLIEQPKGTGNCGQCVAAMLACQPLESAIAIMGEGRTSVASLAECLDRFDIFLLRSPQPVSSELEFPKSPGALLLEVETPSGKSFKHWIAWDGTLILDPKFGKRSTLQRTMTERVLSAEFFSAEAV